MVFFYQKLYTDCITSSGDIFIVYLTWLRWLGVEQCACGFEWYSPDGTRKVHQTSKPPRDLNGLHEEGAISFSLDLPSPLHVQITPSLSPWRPSGTSPLQGLSWSNRVPRANVQLRWETPSSPTLWEGDGYADWVEITQRPSTLPLQTLQWGRLHLPETTVVYTHLIAKDGTPWTRVGEWSQGEFRETHDLTLQDQAPAFHLELSQPLASSQCYTLTPQRVLHQGDAINKERYPQVLQRTIARWLSGPMTETRWYSRVQSQTDPRQTGWALHERVFFGKHQEK